MLELPTVLAVPVQLSMVIVWALGVKLAKQSTPTVPVPKSRCDVLVVNVSAPMPTALALPSLKFPFAKVPPDKVMVALLLMRSMLGVPPL